MVPSWYSGPFDGYNGNIRWRRRPHSKRLERDFQNFRQRAGKLLNVLDVWE